MFLEFKNPIPVVTPLGDGYAIYVQSSGTFENDIWCVAIKDGGKLYHFTTDQLLMCCNGTFNIKKAKNINIAGE